MTETRSTRRPARSAEYRRLNAAFLAAMDAADVSGDYTEARRLSDAMLAADGYVPPTAAEEHAENARIARAEAR